MRADLVTIVAARRGVSALRQLLSQLPATFQAPIVCLVESDPRLADALQSSSRLKVRWAESGARLEKRTVYLSPPGRSLILRPDDTLSVAPFGVDASGLEPVDYFLSSASRHGVGLLSLVLAGFERDGVAGCKAIRDHGGSVLVLDRATAQYWGMAEPVVRAGASDHVLTLTDIAEAMRACFPSEDILRCAEIQFEIGGLLETALRVSGTGMGVVSRVAKDDHLGLLVQRGLTADSVERIDPLPASPDPACGRWLLEKTRNVLPDLAASPSAGFRDLARALGFRAVHAVPLIDAGSPRGVLATLFPQPHEVAAAEANDIDHLVRRIAPILREIS